jgi:hypothetical protein
MEGSLVAYKVFTNGSTLQASELNENLMQQSTAVFSNAAARTAAITSPVEGQLTYLEDTNQYASWNGSAWVSPFGLTLVKSQTIGSAVASVTVNDVFSAEYDDYKVTITGGVGSAQANLTLALGTETTAYYSNLVYGNYGTSTPLSIANTNGTKFPYVGATGPNNSNGTIEIQHPFLTQQTSVFASIARFGSGAFSGVSNGFQQTVASHTGFTIGVDSGTLTGGTIRVYGYRKA